MGREDAAQLGDHFSMPRLACGGSVGTGEEAALEPGIIEVLSIGEGVGGIGAAEEGAEGGGVDVLVADLSVVSAEGEEQLLEGLEEGGGVELALVPDEGDVAAGLRMRVNSARVSGVLNQ